VPSKKASVPSLGAKLTAIKPPMAVLRPASVDSSSGHHMAPGSMRDSSPVLCAAISACIVAAAACAVSGSRKDHAASAVGDLALGFGPYSHGGLLFEVGQHVEDTYNTGEQQIWCARKALK
jgi:hypothetical protein